ncbi:MAG: copper oxidase [Anaerolineaceae bacterium]|nr:copper oxidase [Anaerolineaceae bacterium]
MRKIYVIFPIIITSLFLLTACSTQSKSEIFNVMESEDKLSATVTPGTMAPSSDSNHMMQPISGENIQNTSDGIGGQPLDFRLEGNVKVFELVTKPVKWQIIQDVFVTAWTYNGTVPGPMIRVTEGDIVRILIKNELPEPTTIHWHGIAVPNAMDGIPDITQKPILPGETFTYEFIAQLTGTYMYHSHYDGDVQVSAGLYAPFIIDPKELTSPAPDIDVNLMISEWLLRDGETFAAMPMAGMEPNYFTINGKAFPDTETINVKKGQLVRLRLAGIGQFVHPIHLHGVPFTIVATDGHPVPKAAQLTKDTVLVSPGERYDIEFVATESGQWILHCHILHHTTNNNVEPGGLMLIINVTD